MIMMGSLQPWNLLWMSISVIAISWLPACGHEALPLRSRAAIGPGRCGRASTGCLILSALRGAHHPQIFRVFAVVHTPAIVFAVFYGLLCSFATHIIHPDRPWEREPTSHNYICCIFYSYVSQSFSLMCQDQSRLLYDFTLDFYWCPDLKLHHGV